MSLNKLDKMPVSRMVLHPSFGQILNKEQAPESVLNMESKMMYTWYDVEQDGQVYGVYIVAEIPGANQTFAVRSYPIYLQ